MTTNASTRRARPLRLSVLLLAMLTALTVGIGEVGVGVERLLGDLRSGLRTRDASGEVQVIEIDATSLRAINRWPWPRHEHARLLDRLRDAGAHVIAFDIDFSSHAADYTGDVALAAALRRAGGGVVLPTLRQEAGLTGDGFVDALPIPALRAHSLMGAVSMAPDADGYVRQAPMGIVTAGLARPSFSAMIADRAGRAGTQFPIDYAIDPATIPRHRFVDIRDGRFAPGSFAGKRVIVGATAVEVGDRYAVPRFGVIPGVVVQALATETLLRGVPMRLDWPWFVLLAAPLALAVLRMRHRAALAAAIVAAPALILGFALLLEAQFSVFPQLVPALVVIVVASAGALALRWGAMMRRKRAHDVETGLPNRFAMREALDDAAIAVAAARIVEYDKLAAGLTPGQMAQMICRVRDRIALIADGAAIYRVEDRLLAWPSDVEPGALHERFDALRVAMLSPVEVDGRRVDVVLSFGAARNSGGDIARTTANAALAADRAAAAGESWQVGGDADDADLSLLGELDEAVARGEIEVLYQPKLDLATDRIASVEALVRWRHPTRGYLRPDLFIPQAERGGRIAGLTVAVLDRTIADLQAWEAAGHRIGGAINLSAKLVAAPEFMGLVKERIAFTGIAPSLVTLEVTESAAMTDPAGAAAALGAFRAFGVKVSMDDYGTGQSTLSYLRELPLDELKIDRSFVQFAHENGSDAVLVRSTVDLAHALGLTVVAEGVEDEACLAYLRSIGCDMAQGYLISRPVSADTIAAMLADEQRAAA